MRRFELTPVGQSAAEGAGPLLRDRELRRWVDFQPVASKAVGALDSDIDAITNVVASHPDMDGYRALHWSLGAAGGKTELYLCCGCTILAKTVLPVHIGASITEALETLR